MPSKGGCDYVQCEEVICAVMGVIISSKGLIMWSKRGDKLHHGVDHAQHVQ
jgi:hypothetical protein